MYIDLVNNVGKEKIASLRFGYYKNNALKRMFQLAGQGGYEKTTGLMRKRINAMLMNYWIKPSPV